MEASRGTVGTRLYQEPDCEPVKEPGEVTGPPCNYFVGHVTYGFIAPLGWAIPPTILLRVGRLIGGFAEHATASRGNARRRPFHTAGRKLWEDTVRVCKKKPLPENWEALLMMVEVKLAAGMSLNKAIKASGTTERTYWKMRDEKAGHKPRAATNLMWRKK